MAVPGWYTTWAETHRKTFVLSAEWVDAAELWWEIFESRGVTGSELTAATRDLMTLGANAPKYPGDHLPAVERSIGRARNAAAVERRKSYGETDAARCDLCLDGGWVIVPHPKFVRNGRWEPSHYRESGSPNYVTAAVACKCDRGQSTVESCGQQNRPTQTLANYETFCPNWRIELDEKAHAEHRSHVIGEQAASLADGADGIDRLKQRLFSGPRG